MGKQAWKWPLTLKIKLKLQKNSRQKCHIEEKCKHTTISGTKDYYQKQTWLT